MKVGNIDEEDDDEEFPHLGEGENYGNKSDPVDQQAEGLTSEHLKFKSFMVTNQIPSPRKIHKSPS